MAAQKRRKPPPRDAGGDLQNEQLGGGLEIKNTTLGSDLQDFRASLLSRRYALPPSLARAVAAVAFDTLEAR